MMAVTRYVVLALLRGSGRANFDSVRSVVLDVMPALTGVVPNLGVDELRREFNRVGRELKRSCGDGVVLERDVEIRVVDARCMEVVERKLREIKSSEWRRRLPELIRIYIEAADQVLAV